MTVTIFSKNFAVTKHNFGTPPHSYIATLTVLLELLRSRLFLRVRWVSGAEGCGLCPHIHCGDTILGIFRWRWVDVLDFAANVGFILGEVLGVNLGHSVRKRAKRLNPIAQTHIHF
jgi:hypothetical protein